MDKGKNISHFLKFSARLKYIFEAHQNKNIETPSTATAGESTGEDRDIVFQQSSNPFFDSNLVLQKETGLSE